jgi:hypothetical protein
MAIAMRYLFQGWNSRMPGKCKDLIMDIATEEVGHVEMIATMVARLLEGAPATATTKADAADPVVGRGCRPYSTRLMRASWAGNCALPPFPASLLFDSYLPLVFLGFRSDRLTVLPWGAGMTPTPTPTSTMYTPPTQLDGTITGIILTVIVAVLALAALIALVFWAARQKPT